MIRYPHMAPNLALSPAFDLSTRGAPGPLEVCLMPGTVVTSLHILMPDAA